MFHVTGTYHTHTVESRVYEAPEKCSEMVVEKITVFSKQWSAVYEIYGKKENMF